METIDFLLAQPFALLVMLAIGAAISIAAERIGNNLNAAKRKAYWRGRNDAKGKATAVQVRSGERSANAAESDFAAYQLKRVSTATFTARALLNQAEANVFTALDKAVIARNPAWQVMAQVSPVDHA